MQPPNPHLPGTRLALLVLAVASTPAFAHPPLQIEVVANTAVSQFPDAVVFSLEATSPATITQAVLEFGTDAKTCGQSTDRVMPEVSGGTSASARWTWDLRRTGALPPGTTVWWHWVVQDGAGHSLTTPDQTLVIEDTDHTWKEASAGPLRLHWYAGEAAFADTLLQAGQQALASIRASTGIDFTEQTRLYIYQDPSSMQSATLFAPSWSGGLAFPEHDAVLIAIAPDELTWGKRAVAHELTHLVIGQYTFSCLNSTPAWVDEGLAMYNEGDPDNWTVSVLQDAVRQNTLLPVRSLSQGFSNDPDLANLSYAQSQSLVAFLVEQYGPQPMLRLLDEFRRGTPEDMALRAVYGFDRDGLEAAWREHIGAPAAATTPSQGGQSTITPYPTFAPLVAGGFSGTPQPTDTARPAPTASTATPPPSGGGAGICGTPAFVLAGLVIARPRRRRRSR